MTDKKITELTELTSVAEGDLLAIVDDPSGTPVTKKATVANVGAGIKIDNLAAGDDNTDLDATSTKHGLALKVSATAGQALVSDGTNQKYIDQDFTIAMVFGDGVNALTTSAVVLPIVIPKDCVIEKVQVLGDTGSIVVDLWKDTYANYPPTDADSITSAAPPTLAAAAKSEDSTLTGWTTSMSKGDILLPNIDSTSDLTWAIVILFCRSTATA